MAIPKKNYLKVNTAPLFHAIQIWERIEKGPQKIAEFRSSQLASLSEDGNTKIASQMNDFFLHGSAIVTWKIYKRLNKTIMCS